MYCGDRPRHKDLGYCPGGNLTSYMKADGSVIDRYPTCSICNQPTREDWERLTARLAPIGVSHLSSVVGTSDGILTCTWTKWVTVDGKISSIKIITIQYLPYPFTRVNDMDQGRDHLQKIWKMLDNDIDLIRQDPMASSAETLKASARAFAEVLAQLMSPFYEDSDAVLRESMNRWTARQEGNTGHETPGLAEHEWDPAVHNSDRIGLPSVGYKPSNGGAGEIRVIQAAPLEAQKCTFIKHSLDTGAMDAATLAGMFGVSPEIIQSSYDAAP